MKKYQSNNVLIFKIPSHLIYDPCLNKAKPRGFSNLPAFFLALIIKNLNDIKYLQNSKKKANLKILTLMCLNGLPHHAPVAPKIADQR